MMPRAVPASPRSALAGIAGVTPPAGGGRRAEPSSGHSSRARRAGLALRVNEKPVSSRLDPGLRQHAVQSGDEPQNLGRDRLTQVRDRRFQGRGLALRAAPIRLRDLDVFRLGLVWQRSRAPVVPEPASLPAGSLARHAE